MSAFLLGIVVGGIVAVLIGGVVGLRFALNVWNRS